MTARIAADLAELRKNLADGASELPKTTAAMRRLGAEDHEAMEAHERRGLMGVCMASASLVEAPLQVHPAAEIFPPMSEAEYAALVADVRAYGLREPIWITADDQILDGRHRYRACLEADVDPQFRTWDGTGSVVDFIVSLNLHRRHLDASQRALVAARIATLGQGARTDIAQISAMSQPQAAALLNVSRGSVQNAERVLDEGAPELVQAVERGQIAVSAAAEATELEPEIQREIVERVEAGEKPAEVLREYKPHVAQNSGNNEWYTPPTLIEAAREVMGGIDCDPASSQVANATVQAERFFTRDEDGLRQTSWGERVWMNPPYAQPLIGQFADELARRFEAGEVREACVLVNNATETAWFQTLLTVASAVCFLRGRVRFLDSEGNPSGAPLQGQAVLYLGSDPAHFGEAFTEHGVVLYA